MFKRIQITPASDRSILIKFDNDISEKAHYHTAHYSNILLSSYCSYIKNISPAYNSILIRLKDQITINEMHKELNNLFENEVNIKQLKTKTIKVPVCYDSEYSPDMERVMKYTGFNRDVIIKKHSTAEYSVYFLGFSPGFPYIGGMEDSLETPRLKKPRTIVPAGSIAIGGKQTGIYPMESPGGWNIIGRTYLNLFDWKNVEKMPIKMGSKIEFYPINKDEFLSKKNTLK